MTNRQLIDKLNEMDHDELPDLGNFTDFGRAIEYGKKTKAKQRRTVDGEARRQQRIQFADTDHPDNDNDTARDLEEDLGFKPFGSEW